MEGGAFLENESPLRRIRRMSALSRQLDADITTAVTEARAEGDSWSQIAIAMGKHSRQAALRWYQRRQVREPA